MDCTKENRACKPILQNLNEFQLLISAIFNCLYGNSSKPYQNEYLRLVKTISILSLRVVEDGWKNFKINRMHVNAA